MKKSISSILATIMAFSLLTVPAFAAEKTMKDIMKETMDNIEEGHEVNTDIENSREAEDALKQVQEEMMRQAKEGTLVYEVPARWFVEKTSSTSLFEACNNFYLGVNSELVAKANTLAMGATGEIRPDAYISEDMLSDYKSVYDLLDTYGFVLTADECGKLIDVADNTKQYIIEAEFRDRDKLVQHLEDCKTLLSSGLSNQSTATAVPTTSKIYVDGKVVTFEAYHINSNNYFKLGDVAQILRGTKAQFEVSWDREKSSINMVSGKAYTTVGDELKAGNGQSKSATLTTSPIYLNGSQVEMTAYHIGGNNFFKLRDIGKALGFNVSWDKSLNAVVVDSLTGYTED